MRRGIDAGLDAVILNPSNVFGPHDRSGWVRVFLLVEQRKLPVLYPGRATSSHVREIARAHVAAADRGRCGANYLLGGADATYAEVTRTIAELLGKRAPRRTLPVPVLRAFAAISVLPSYVTRREPPGTPEAAYIVCRSLLCSSDSAVRELGYRPAPLRTMLEDTHRWLVAEGLVPRRPDAPGGARSAGAAAPSAGEGPAR